MRISEIQIDRYGPLGGLQEECEDGIKVFHGPNESGKTLLLDALLKLLDPNISSEYQRIQRVEETPSGYVVVETGDGEEKLGDGTTLSNISPIEARHLRNIFTVRDNDLSLDDQHTFYNSLTEQIGDLHTSEIETIQDEFEDRGRLTSERRNVSSAAGYDNAKNVRNTASELADQISQYVAEAKAADLDDTERELIQVERTLRTCREELTDQKQARVVHEYDRLTDRLATYREVSEELESRYDFSQDELEELTSLSSTISGATDDITDAEDDIDSLESDVDEWEDELATKESELQMLERREDAVEETESDLQSFRNERSEVEGSDRWLETTKWIAIVGLALGGGATITGALQGQFVFLALSVLLLGIGVLGGAAWMYMHRQVTSLANRRSALLEQARDAGFDVESVSDIGPAIQAYRDELEAVTSRISDLEQEIEVAEQRIEDHESTISEARDRRQDSREEKREILREADVEDIDAYRSAFDDTSSLETDRSNARQSLVDSLAEPDVSDADPDTMIEYWESELAAMVDDIDVETVDPDDYDQDTLDELREKRTELEGRKEELEQTLEDHENSIREFKDRAHELRTAPFLDSSITLKAETVDGLEQLQRDLRALGERINRDAEISRVGLEIFDEIHDEEEEKITDLFDSDGRASEVFATITQERYEDVSYDPEKRQLLVEDRNGQILTPEELSHGTREQLYFATRVSLSEQLLGNESGFFILDDAFLPADKARLEEGFEVLQDLVANGWQVLYLTAKQEVGVEMVETFDLPRTELERLP